MPNLEAIGQPIKGKRGGGGTMFNRHQSFSTNKQYIMMQNETNLWSSFLVKTKYWQNFDLKA